MTIEELKMQLDALLEKGQDADDVEVRICNLNNDDDEKFHFREIKDIGAVTIRRKRFIAIYIQD